MPNDQDDDRIEREFRIQHNRKEALRLHAESISHSDALSQLTGKEHKIIEVRTPSVLRGVSHFRYHTNTAMLKRLHKPAAIKNFYIQLDDPEIKLSATDRWIFTSIGTLMEYGNVVSASAQNIADKSVTSSRQVQRTLKKLLDAHCFLAKITEATGALPPTYLVCPLYFSMGKPENMVECVDKWNKHIKKIYSQTDTVSFENPFLEISDGLLPATHQDDYSTS